MPNLAFLYISHENVRVTVQTLVSSVQHAGYCMLHYANPALIFTHQPLKSKYYP